MELKLIPDDAYVLASVILYLQFDNQLVSWIASSEIG